MQCLDRLPLQSPMGSQQLLLLLFLLLQLLLRANAEQPRPLNDEVLASQSSGAAAAGAAKQQEAAAAGSLQRAHDSDTAAASHAAAAIAEAAPAAAPEAAGAAAAAADAAADAAAAQAVEKLLRGQQRLPLTYSNVLQLLPQLQRRYPHLIRVRDAVKAFGLQDQLGGLRCGRESCRVPYLEVGLRSQLNRSTPAIFYSGLVHGDEVVGPTASVYLAALLASQFDKLEEVFYLLSNRLLVIFPFFNPWGFSRRAREERGIDPNRDFPYLNPACFSALTSRLVGAAFERYLFIGGITWHGGMRAIARPWGSYDHSEAVSGGYRSRPAPDEVALATVGKWLQEAGGPSAAEYRSPYLSDYFKAVQRKQRQEYLERLERERRQRQGGLFGLFAAEDEGDFPKAVPYFYYPEAPISDLVYPVNGGLEDWAYSAAFQPSPNPISACVLHAAPRNGRWRVRRATGSGNARDGLAREEFEDDEEVEEEYKGDKAQQQEQQQEQQQQQQEQQQQQQEQEQEHQQQVERDVVPRRLGIVSSFWNMFGSWWGEGPPVGAAQSVRPHAEFDKSGVRCAMYLVETHDLKDPPAKAYGTSFPVSLTASPSVSDGLISRNTRIALKLAEKVQPDVLVLAGPGVYQAPGCIVNFALWAVGCETLDSLQVVAKRGRCADFVRKEKRPLPKGIQEAYLEDHHEVYELTPAWHSTPPLTDEHILQRSCRSAAPWERPSGNKPEPLFRSWQKEKNEIYNAFSAAEREGLDFFRFKIPPETPSGEVCILMFGEFDKSWTETVRGADPPLPPQSWLAQSRKGVSTGRAPKGSAILKGERQWIFPTRSPTFPGNGSPVGFTVNIRADGVEGFVSLSLPLPARQEQNGRDGDTPERAATQVQLSLLVGGFLNDAPIIFNPYTRILDPHRTAAQQQEHLQQEQQQQQPAFGATRAAADVQLGVHPGLSRLPEGLLLLQIERLDPAYTGSSSSSRRVLVTSIATGSERTWREEQQQLFTHVLLHTDQEVRVRLSIPVSRLLGQRVIATWLPAAAAARLGSASAAAAATAAAAAAGEPPLGTSAAAPLAGSQHVPLLSDQVNEDFVRFLLHRLKLSKTRPSAAAAAAAVTEGLDLFFPYARSFACAFSSFLLLPEKPSFSLNRHNDNRRLSGNVGAAQRGSLGDRDRDRGQAPSLTGKLDVSSVWTKPHSGVTSLVGEFTAQEDFDFPLLLQFAERCCLDLLLHRQANGWALRAAFSILNCACGPGTVVKATLLPSTAASRSSSSSSSLGPDEELSGARVCSAEEAAAAAAAAAGGEAPVVTAYGVYGESPEQRIRVLQQLQQQQQGGEGQQLTPHEVAATVRRVAGVKGVVLIGTQGLEIEGGGLLSLEHLRTQAAKGAFLGVLLWGLVLLASLLFILSAGVLAWKRLGRHVHFAAAAAAAAGVFNGRLGRSCRAAPPYQVLGARPAEYAADGGDSLALPGPAAAPPTAAAPAAAATVL